MQTIIEHAQLILTAEQLAAIAAAVRGDADAHVLLTRDQVAGMAAHMAAAD